MSSLEHTPSIERPVNVGYRNPTIVADTSSMEVPNIVFGRGVTDVAVDPEEAAETLLELTMPQDMIRHTALYFGGGFNISRKGLQISGELDRLLHGVQERNQEIRYILRINTMLRGELRTAEAMNRTFVHEGAHAAQAARRDPRLYAGNMALWGIAGLGAAAGYRLGNETNSRIGALVGPAVGLAIGHSIGYKIAPHEREARRMAETVTSHAIRLNRQG